MQLLKIENAMFKIFQIDQSLVFKKKNQKCKSVKEKVAFSPKFNDFPINKNEDYKYIQIKNMMLS